MSLREWLIAIGALVILGIVIDGVRRMRRTRREAAAISSGMGADDIADPDQGDGHNPELPNGGSRPIDRAELESRGYLKAAKGGPRFSNPPPKPTRPIVGSSSASSATHADEDIADSGLTARDTRDGDLTEESLSAYDDDHPGSARGPSIPEEDSEVRWGNEHESGVATSAASPEVSEPAGESDAQSTSKTSEETKAAGTPHWQDSAVNSEVEVTSDPSRPAAGGNRPDAQEVIVINVLANQDRLFDGDSLRRLFEGCGLEFGDMAIYHRHEENDTRSPVQFSVANALEPGTFRNQDIDGMKTPGISFFMSLPGPSDSMQAFEFMLETAQCVVKNLDGELKDERRSVMTRQTIEHCRQRIREYERKRRSQRVG